jgi:hypothetical protein
MNFFGHLVAAGWERTNLAFSFGAMWPDLAGMAELRSTAARDPDVQLGVAHHHRADAYFHHSRHFVTFQRQAFEWLTTRGVERGPARAVAHVGVELLLDAELARDPDHVVHYADALGHAEPRRWARWMATGDTAEQARFEALRDGLLLRIPHLVPRTPSDVAARLERILSPRPRLALSEPARPLVRDWVEQAWPDVRATLNEWCQDLRSALAPVTLHQRPSAEGGT